MDNVSHIVESKKWTSMNVTFLFFLESDEDLSSEEKQKLYKAIGYQAGVPAPIYPESYIDITAMFTLRTLELEIRDEQMQTKTALFTELKGVTCKYDSRSAANAMK